MVTGGGLRESNGPCEIIVPLPGPTKGPGVGVIAVMGPPGSVVPGAGVVVSKVVGVGGMWDWDTGMAA